MTDRRLLCKSPIHNRDELPATIKPVIDNYMSVFKNLVSTLMSHWDLNKPIAVMMVRETLRYMKCEAEKENGERLQYPEFVNSVWGLLASLDIYKYRRFCQGAYGRVLPVPSISIEENEPCNRCEYSEEKYHSIWQRRPLIGLSYFSKCPETHETTMI